MKNEIEDFDSFMENEDKNVVGELTHFTEKNLNMLRKDMENYLKILSIKHKVSFKLGKITYTDQAFSCKLDALIVDKATDLEKNPIAIRAEKNWDSYYFKYGLQKTDLGKKFNHKNYVFRIVGITPNKKIRPILCFDETNKEYSNFPIILLKSIIND